ncbi:MAG: DUF4886 domain-containing protein [Bacteroidales bacterium]|nr:DUF4886 domain-containing protein [Bacteroidales bacterium]
MAIGNSFSEDAVENYLYDLGKDKNIKFIIGNLYIGGCSLERHRNNSVSNSKDYSYRKINKDGVFTTKNNQTLEYALKDENWDYISFQQASPLSGIESSYFPYLTELKKYVNNNCSNNNVKYLFHQTWAYSNNSQHSGFKNYDKNQDKMFLFIKASSQDAIKKADLDIMVPSGTAVQNVRNTEIGDNLCRDGYHLDKRIGRFTAACAWFEAITKIDVTTNSYTPEDISKESSLIKKSVHKAFEEQ